MTSTDERLTILEGRVNTLETWAGPGQSEVLATGLAEMRKDIRKILRTQERHTRQLADLTGDVSDLKTDMTEVKTRLDEVTATLETVVTTLNTVVRTLGVVVDHLGIAVPDSTTA